jgi:hypothetical protein
MIVFNKSRRRLSQLSSASFLSLSLQVHSKDNLCWVLGTSVQKKGLKYKEKIVIVSKKSAGTVFKFFIF